MCSPLPPQLALCKTLNWLDNGIKTWNTRIRVSDLGETGEDRSWALVMIVSSGRLERLQEIFVVEAVESKSSLCHVRCVIFE